MKLFITVLLSDPRCIFSKPRANTQLHAPLSITFFAKNNAVDPVEQLLLTFTIGMPVRPNSYTAL
jgi:hypothetical protein